MTTFRTFSRVSNQGTAMAEATLCVLHFADPWLSSANADADAASDRDVEGLWHDSTGNDAARWVECGA